MSYIFRFNGYKLDGNKLSFHYSYLQNDDVIKDFTEVFVLPSDLIVDTSSKLIQKILQHFHVVVGISYYKSQLGEVKLPYKLNQAEADYYNSVYDKGLGEYSYINKLTEPITPFTTTSSEVSDAIRIKTSGAIMGIGGGKDSIVAVELFKQLGIKTTVLDMATGSHHGQAAEVMDITGQPQMHVERHIDTSIKDFTDQTMGNHGHVPLSTIIAWLGTLLAASMGAKFVAMANEGGTSTGNTVWNGREVNHQWAKSIEAEKLTQNFIESQLTPDIHYLSPIRPYGSLVIMEILAKIGQPYLNHFTSCNLVLRIDPSTRPTGRWCTRCAKCLSTWLLLSYWMNDDELISVFGRNLWEDTEQHSNLLSLLGLEGHKPLDCVGTIEELRAVTRKVLDEGRPYPLLEGIKAEDIPSKTIEELVHERFEHNLPDDLANDIEKLVSSLI